MVGCGEHPEVAVDGAAVEHLDQHLPVVAIEEGEESGVVGAAVDQLARAAAAHAVVPVDLDGEALVLQAGASATRPAAVLGADHELVGPIEMVGNRLPFAQGDLALAAHLRQQLDVVGARLQQPRPDDGGVADLRHLVEQSQAVVVEEPNTNALVGRHLEGADRDLGRSVEREVVPVVVVVVESGDAEAPMARQAERFELLVERHGLRGRDRVGPVVGPPVVLFVAVDPADERPAPLVANRKGRGLRHHVLGEHDVVGDAGVDFEGHLEDLGALRHRLGGGLLRDDAARAERPGDQHGRTGRRGRLGTGDDVAAAGIIGHGELVGVTFELCSPVDRRVVVDLTGHRWLVRNAVVLGLDAGGECQDEHGQHCECSMALGWRDRAMGIGMVEFHGGFLESSPTLIGRMGAFGTRRQSLCASQYGTAAGGPPTFWPDRFGR